MAQGPNPVMERWTRWTRIWRARSDGNPRDFQDGERLWSKGGIQPKPQRREPIAGHWLTDAEAFAPHLPQERRATTRIPVKAEPVTKGLIPDARRGDVSPLGGVAKPAPKPKGCKW
jgi:hypothetical protein